MILEVEHLSPTYWPRHPLLYDISLAFEQGQALSILGANRAGKSTLLNYIINLLFPQQGKIRPRGTPPSRLKLRKISRIIDHVLQSHTPAYDYTVRDFVVTDRAPHLGTFQQPGRADYDLADATLEETGLLPLAGRPYTKFSDGERQQVTIARVIVQQSELILLDEPTNHLDYGNQLWIFSTVRILVKRGSGIIMTNYSPDHVLLLSGQVDILGNDDHFLVGDVEEVVTEERLYALYRGDLYLTYVERVGRKACTPGRLKSGEQEGKMESIGVLEEGELLSFRFDEMLNYHDPGFLGSVAYELKVMQRVFPLLDDGNLLERKEISFVAVFPGPRTRDTFELVTHCLIDDRYMVGKELPEAADELGSPGGRYYLRLNYRGRSIAVTLRSGYVREELIQLARKKRRTKTEECVLAGTKCNMAAHLMTAKAEDIY